MKKLVVDAICGRGFHSVLFADQCVQAGMARFTGDQWNADWAWDREALMGCSIDTLRELYEAMREKEGDPLSDEDVDVPVAPAIVVPPGLMQ